MDKRVALIGGMGLGAGLMFLLDPEMGRRRRHVVGDKTRALANDAEVRLGKTARNLRNHAKGWVAESRHLVDHEDVDDVTLVERVRSALGHATPRPGAMEVSATEGTVVLSGPVPVSEMDRVLEAVWSVRGVKAVDNRLAPHGDERPWPEEVATF